MNTQVFQRLCLICGLALGVSSPARGQDDTLRFESPTAATSADRYRQPETTSEKTPLQIIQAKAQARAKRRAERMAINARLGYVPSRPPATTSTPMVGHGAFGLPAGYYPTRWAYYRYR